MNVDSKLPQGDELLKLDNQLCFALYSSARGITRMYRPILSRFNITYPQYLVLLVLWEHGPMNVKDLGEKLFLDSGTLTPLLKRMERMEILSRERSTEDERQVLISLTEKGLNMREEALSVPLELAGNLDLKMDEYRLLMTALKSLINKMELE